MLNKEAPCPLGGGLWIVEKRQNRGGIKEKTSITAGFRTASGILCCVQIALKDTDKMELADGLEPPTC